MNTGADQQFARKKRRLDLTLDQENGSGWGISVTRLLSVNGQLLFRR
jgi:hypothetical protein